MAREHLILRRQVNLKQPGSAHGADLITSKISVPSKAELRPGPGARSVLEGRMMPFLSWLAKVAADLREPAVITVALAVLGAVVQALVPQIRSNAWFTRFVLEPIGILILLCGLLLAFAKFHEPKPRSTGQIGVFSGVST